jgi:hypothetical protein
MKEIKEDKLKLEEKKRENEKIGLLQQLKRLELPIIKIYLNMIKPIFFILFS